MRHYMLLLCLLISSSLCSAQDARFIKLDSLFTILEAGNRAMGSVAITKNGTVQYSRAWGHRYMGTGGNKPADTATLYRIGSVTKTFTAIMVLQLVEANKLALTDKLANWFPQFSHAGEITIAHLLSHSSGLYNFTDTSSYMAYHTREIPRDSLLQLMASYPSDFPPGTETRYSNTNYVLLGYILEKITGSSYAENLQEQIVKKAGLLHTCAGGKINPVRNEALSYEYDGRQWEATDETAMSIPGGAGGIVSTPADINRLATALFRGQLLNSISLATMTNLKDGMGMGLFHLPFGLKSAYGHGGSIDAFSSLFAFFPDDSVAFSGIVNATRLPLNDMMIGVLSIYYGLPYQLPAFDPETEHSIEGLEQFEGVFVSPQVPLKITILRKGGQLTAQATGQPAVPLTPFYEREFRYEAAGLILIFNKDETGVYSQMNLLQGGGNYLFTREAGSAEK